MQHLPTGTVTLLFTDMENSTRLLQQLGKRYTEVLEECRQLLRTACHTSGGQEVDTQGDAFLVAFARATDATSAAVAIQRTLFTHAWLEDVVVQVRMGLHTGEPQLAVEGYVGPDISQVARIMSVAHGGQVLLSQSTRDLVEHNLPVDVSLRDLGEHRLKDLQRPSHLYQLVMAGLPAEFSPLKTLESHPNNLPIQLTPFIGRSREVAAVQDLLQRVRLVTLTGPGGSGKTRMALQVAAEISDVFPDGVYFVNLAPISDPALVVPTIASALGVKETTGQSLHALVNAFLHVKQLLLLLDNFEQVISAATHVTELLVACPSIKIIVTSRAVLHVRGEQEFAVPPLAVPDPKHLPDLITLSQVESVALFLQQAQAVKADFQVTNATAPTIAEICVRLDGLPLAIELAAARIKLLPPPVLLARLDQRLAMLTGGARDAPTRQQTLRCTINWSYQLLDAQEQRLFRRLSVFVGGCTLEATESVSAALGDAMPSVLDGVASLIDKSLLLQPDQEEEESRLVMLETIREFGLERLINSGELQATQQVHADYYLWLAEGAEPQLWGPRQVTWLQRLEQEHGNLRTALRWFLEQGDTTQGIEKALQLGAALRSFWLTRGYYSEGQIFLEQALARSEGIEAPVRAKALSAAATLAGIQDDIDRGEPLSKESLTLYRELGDRRGIAYALYQLGSISASRGELAAARQLSEEALALRREVGNKQDIAWSLINLASEVSEQGEYTRGCALFEESLTLFQELGNIRGIALSLLGLAQVLFLSQSDSATLPSLLEKGIGLLRELDDKNSIADSLILLGEVALSQGDAITARSFAEEGVVLTGEIGDRLSRAGSVAFLAKVIALEGDQVAARAKYEESLALARMGNSKWHIIPGLEGLAGVLASQGDLVWAARLWSSAEALRDALGTPMPPVYRADYERSVVAARAQLGDQDFTTAWNEGRTMPPEQVLGAPGRATVSTQTSTRQLAITTTKPSPRYPVGLTTREVEVLRLVAQGLTDAQIAEQLVLSLHTVHAHLRSIYSKLGVTSRSAATRYAFEHQLI